MGLLHRSRRFRHRSGGLEDRSGGLEHESGQACTLRGASGFQMVAPHEGTYLTDGAALFRVAHTLSDPVRGELFLELEDCTTLDLVLCPAQAVVGSGLRSVIPALVTEPS